MDDETLARAYVEARGIAAHAARSVGLSESAVRERLHGETLPRVIRRLTPLVLHRDHVTLRELALGERAEAATDAVAADSCGRPVVTRRAIDEARQCEIAAGIYAQAAEHAGTIERHSRVTVDTGGETLAALVDGIDALVRGGGPEWGERGSGLLTTDDPAVTAEAARIVRAWMDVPSGVSPEYPERVTVEPPDGGTEE